MRALSAEAGRRPRVGTDSGVPRRLGGLVRAALATASGGGGGCGGPGRGRSVRTRLSRGNYNPAAAPAYRATSDPSKRVAWEFGRRQRLAGEAFGVAATASAPLLPQGKNGDCWGREGLKTTKRGSCSPPPGACHYSPKQVTVASEPRSAEPLLLSTPSGNSQRGSHVFQPFSSA